MRITFETLEPETSDAERDALISALRGANLKGKHLEIGTAAGGTLKQLMRIYPDGQRPQFVVVDTMTYFPNQRELIETNLRRSGLDPAEVDFRVATSRAACRQALANGESFSFIFIDAVHKAKEVTEDLAWTELLEAGGIVAFHDYKPRFPGVVWAVDRFLKKHRNYEIVGRADSLVVARKRCKSPHDAVGRFEIYFASIAGLVLRMRRSLQKRTGS